MDCATCLELHGVGCEGTHEDAAGKWVCLFCLDGEICPVQAKRLRAKKTNPGTPPAASNDNSAKPENEPEDEEKTMQNTESDTPKKIPGTGTGDRRCVRPGCGVELSAANTSGRCRAHVRWRDRPSAGEGNEHAIAVTAKANSVEKTGNGVAPRTNGHAIEADQAASTPKNGSNGAELAGDFLEERLDLLLLNLPAVDKSRIAEKWLRGEI